MHFIVIRRDKDVVETIKLCFAHNLSLKDIAVSGNTVDAMSQRD